MIRLPFKGAQAAFAVGGMPTASRDKPATGRRGAPVIGTHPVRRNRSRDGVQ